MAERRYKKPYEEYFDGTDVGADAALLTTAQQKEMAQHKTAWDKAAAAGDQVGMDAAHKAAESLRAKAGYSGGANGGAYNPFADDGGAKGVHASSVHMTSPTWTPTYTKERASIVNQLQSRAPFSYDPEKDPAYLQYKAQYERGAKKSMSDTMGQVMARTGGLASSFAQTAAQQSYDATMAQLADKIPELRQLAYQMYMDEGDRLRSDLQMYDSLDSTDAARWQGTVLSPFQADRAYAKDMDDTMYSRGQDAMDRQWQEKLFNAERADVDYDRARQERLDTETARQQAMEDAIKQFQYAGDAAGMQGLGWNTENALKQLALEMQSGELGLQQQLAQIAATNRSNRGSSGGSYSAKQGGASSPQEGIVEQMLAAGNMSKARELLAQSGYTNSAQEDLWNLYQSEMQTRGEGGKGLSSGNFNGLRRAINDALRTGDTDKALAFAEQNWDQMTAEQRMLLQDFFRGRGYTLGG